MKKKENWFPSRWGADTWNVEVEPRREGGEAFVFPQGLTPQDGVRLIENLYLEELRDSKAKEFPSSACR